MKKTGMVSLWVLITALLAPFATPSGGGGMENESFYNDKGLAHYNRAYYELLASGKTAEAEEEFNRAVSSFQEAIRINDRFVEAHRNLGRVYTVRKNDELAAEEYGKVVELEPEKPGNYLPLASALERLGQVDEARNVLSRAKSFTGDPRVLESLDRLIEKLDRSGERR